jgi:glycosyltransferase involved in cell wall biosynthesis
VLKLYGDPELCKEMGIKGRKYAAENFSPEVCVTKYEELFRS